MPQKDTLTNRTRQQVMERSRYWKPAPCNLEEAGRGLEKEVAAVSWSVCTLRVLSAVCLLPKPLHSIPNTHQNHKLHQVLVAGESFFHHKLLSTMLHYQKDLVYYLQCPPVRTRQKSRSPALPPLNNQLRFHRTL